MSPEKATAATYARKSNPQEGANGASESVERQVEHAKQYIASKGFTLGPDLIFFDDNVSGATYARLDSRKRMVAAAEAGAFQVLVVSEQSRLGRDMIEVAYTIKTIAESGVKILSYLDDSEISVEDEVAQAMTMLRGFASASERRQTSKRVYDSAVRRVQAGLVAGSKCYGYDNIDVFGPDPGPGGKPKKLHVVRRVNESQAAIVLRIFEMYAAGLGSVKIARRLNAEGIPSPRPRGWSQTTVRGVLRNPIYRGDVVWGRVKTVVRKGKDHNAPRPASEWLRQEQPELRIVPEDLWQTVQARREGRRQAFPRSPRTGQLLGRPTWHDGHSEYPITGFGRCLECGGNIRITHRVHGPKSNRVAVRSYTCATNDDLGTVKCANNIIVRHDVLDRAVVDAISEVLDSRLLEDAVDRALSRLVKGHVAHIDRRGQIERDLAQVAIREQRLVDAFTRGDAPDALIAALKVEQERKRVLAAELEGLAQAGQVASLDAARIKRELRVKATDVRALLTENVQQCRAMFRKILDGQIEVEPIRDGDRRGFRFRGYLTFNRLIGGEAVTLIGTSARAAGSPGMNSVTGTAGAGTSAAARAPGPPGCGCLQPGAGSPRSGGA